MFPPDHGEDWVGLSAEPLPVETARAWVTRPDCGAVVLFTGVVRDHAEGRSGVTALEYEAWDEAVTAGVASIAAEARRRWPVLGRVVIWHRSGTLRVGEDAVVVAVSTPHRAEAFAAAAWCIDTAKESLPIWKHETWAGGADWGTGAIPIVTVS